MLIYLRRPLDCGEECGEGVSWFWGRISQRAGGQVRQAQGYIMGLRVYLRELRRTSGASG